MTTAVETGRLSELENIIERGLQTFIEVGEALREIRESRLGAEVRFATEEMMPYTGPACEEIG